nr:reverse transcriptase domain-containing protein [Tanacetum cinerariifolium]
MLVEVSKFTFPVDFVILEIKEDSKDPFILGRPFLHNVDAVISVKQKQLNLGVGMERMTFSIDSAMKHSHSNDDTCFIIDVINDILEEYFDAHLDEGSKILYSIEGTLLEDKIFAEFDEFIAMPIEKTVAPPNLQRSGIQHWDNRAPMLEENDYESWKICMKRYIRSKPQGKAILKSIVEGPAPHPMTAAVTGVAIMVVEAPRPKRDEEFTAEENARDLADIQAANILSQEFTAEENARDLADIQAANILSQELFDEYQRFRAIGNESIHEYFIRFHKLANDLKITKIKIPTHQQNTNFLNNLPSYWAKYVTSVKQNQDISTKLYVELYTYLKAYEPHALKTLKKQEQSSSSVDPLAYLSYSSKHQTSTTVALPTSTLAPEQQAQSRSDAMMATMQQLVNLLSGFHKQFPPTNNQLRTSSNPRSHATVHEGKIVTEIVQRKALGNVSNAGTKGNQGYGKKTDRNGKKVICYNCRGEGHVARECKEPKRAKDTLYYKDKMMLSDAKDRGVILDAEAEAFLAMKVLVKEVKEFEKIFDELDDEYEQGVKKLKSLEITNRNLVREIECLTSDSIANDVCAIVRTADVRMPLDVEISSSCVRELSKGLELEAKIAKKNKMLS